MVVIREDSVFLTRFNTGPLF